MNNPMIDFSGNYISHKKAAINGLAVVGFIALVGAGIALAVYSTRFVPAVVNGAGSAAVYVGSLFTPAPGLSVVPTPVASTTIPFLEATSTPATTATTTPATTTKPVKTGTIAGTQTSSVYQISGTSTPVFYGLPDLVVTINEIGYLATSSTESIVARQSFVASSSVPFGFRPAIHFTIKNVGTNVIGMWRWSASVPSSSYPIQFFPKQSSLNPGDSIEYWLGFDEATVGTDKMISITANFDHAVAESNTNNNSASAKVTILGS